MSLPVSDNARRRTTWEYSSSPGSVTISGIQYDLSRAADGTIHCPAPTCPYITQRRSTFRAHAASHDDTVCPAPVSPSSSHHVPLLQPAVHQVPYTPSNNTNAVNIHLPDDQVPAVQSTSPDQGRVVLRVGEDYILSTSLLDQFGLCMHTSLHIFICMACGKCLTASMVPGHKELHHNQTLTAQQLASLQQFAAENNVYLRQEEVKIPAHGGPPVQLIAPPSKGFLCTLSSDCHYAASALPTMLNHARQVHKVNKHAASYEEAHIQQLFESVGRVYFVVTQPPPSDRAISIREALAQSFLPSIDAPAIPSSAIPDEERRSLIKVMAWDHLMGNVRSHKPQIAALQNLKARHRPEELDGFFNILDSFIKAYFDMAPTLLDGNPQRFTICKLLLNGENVTKDSDYWTPISSKNTSYAELVIQFVRAIVRLRETTNYVTEFSFMLHKNQDDALLALIIALHQRSQDSINSHDDDAMKKLHEFFWTLMDSSSVHLEMNWGNVIQRFICLRALRQDGNFYEATDLTPDLAKLKYFLNVSCLIHALWYQNDSNISQCQRVIEAHQEVLALGRPTTFNMIYEYQQYASSLAFNQTREPRVYLDPAWQWITVGQGTMSFNLFRQGIQTLLEQVEQNYLLLTQGRTMLDGLPPHIADDMTNSTRGHSFAKDGQFDSLRLVLFSHLVEIHHLAMVDRGGRLAWDIPAVKDILRRTGEIWKPLYHLLYITTQISTRGVQFLQHQIANAERHRNVFVQGQEVILLSGYSKTTNITDRDSCTPGFIHPKLGRWIVEFLAGGLRHAESLLARVAYGEMAQHEYNTFLVMGNGGRVKPEEWYAIFAQLNRENFSCTWGVRDFRHGAIAMAREFISPNHAFSLADELLAESADHSVQIDHIHYGTVHGTVPQLTNNVMAKHRWLSGEWQLFCGLGPGQPQEPIAKQGRPGSSSFNVSLNTYMQDNLAPLLRDIVTQDVFPPMLDTYMRDKLAPMMHGIISQEVLSPMLDIYMQEKLVPLLRDVITRDVLPPILDAMQRSSMVMTSQNSAPAPTMQPVAGTGWNTPVQPQGRSQQATPAPLSTPVVRIKGKGRAIEYIDVDALDESHSMQHPTIFPIQPPPSSSHPDIPTTDPVHQKVRLPPQPPSFSSSPVAPPSILFRRKRPLIPDASSQLDARGDPIDTKRIRLATSCLDTADLAIKKEREEGSVAMACSSQAEDLLLEDSDVDWDDHAFHKTADSSGYSELVSGGEDSEIEVSAPLSQEMEKKWTEEVRAAFRLLFKDPTAKEKSPAQLKAIMVVMNGRKDTLITLKTGGGKSALWMTAPLINPHHRCIVVCPFVVLLEEQVDRCLQFGLRAHNFTKDKDVPLDVQILFVQVESSSSKAFQDFLCSPLGSSFTHIFIDEHHDFLVCHPARKEPWLRLATQFSKCRQQINFLSATSPPANTGAYLEPFSLKSSDIETYRTCTDRAEIGFHVLHILPNHLNAALRALVHQLQLKLGESDRMLVFFSTNKEADAFSAAMHCSVFHSDLPILQGNTKTDNLARWDRGDTQVMACTTAFAQGVDRSSVRFVVIAGVEYGLLVVNQMSGRAGRDGREAHTFYLTQTTSLCSFESEQDYHCIKGLDDVLFSKDCRRYTSIKCMDGKGFAYRCKDRTDAVRCDICDPTSAIHLFALQAIKDSLSPPLSLSANLAPKVLVPSSSQPSQPSSSGPATCSPRRSLKLWTPSSQQSSQLSSSIASSSRLSAHPSLGPSFAPSQHSSTPSQPSSSRPTAHSSFRRPKILVPSSSQLSQPPSSIASSGRLSAHPSFGPSASSIHSSLPITSNVFKAPASNASPLAIGTEGRYEKVTSHLAARLAQTSSLDRYMRKLQNCCPTHLGLTCTVTAAHSQCPLSNDEVYGDTYQAFRKSFHFEKYTYCFNCALPQSKGRNNEEPSCHSRVVYKKGVPCPFSGFIFRAVWCVWKSGVAGDLAESVGLRGGWGSEHEFISWANKEERHGGKYINLLELFIVFCKGLEASDPTIFH